MKLSRLACLVVLLLEQQQQQQQMIHAFSLHSSTVQGGQYQPANHRLENDGAPTMTTTAAGMLDDQKTTDMDAASQITTSNLPMTNPTTTEKIAQQPQHLKISWEPQVAELLSRLEQVSNPTRPFMVAVVGIPGSGKSTSADILQSLLNNNNNNNGGQHDRVFVMPMDGFHIPLAQLKKHANAADVIYRRGAPDTFDAVALQDALHKIAYGNNEKEPENTVSIPGFDHAVGDPIPNQHMFRRDRHRIVICEGLYLLHDDDGWANIKSVFDWTIYIDANVDVCVARLKERNKCIPGYTPEEIEIRCEAVDRVNAMLTRKGAFKYASQIVSSSSGTASAMRDPE